MYDIHKPLRPCITPMQVDSCCMAAAAQTYIWLPYSEQKEKNQVFTKKKNNKKNEKEFSVKIIIEM